MDTRGDEESRVTWEAPNFTPSFTNSGFFLASSTAYSPASRLAFAKPVVL